MLIRALKDCSFRTKTDRELKEGQVYIIEDGKYQDILKGYRGVIELLPTYIQYLSEDVYKGKPCKKGDILEVDFNTYYSLKSRYYERFKFFDTPKEYNELLKKFKKGEKVEVPEEKVESEEIATMEDIEVPEETENPIIETIGNVE